MIIIGEYTNEITKYFDNFRVKNRPVLPEYDYAYIMVTRMEDADQFEFCFRVPGHTFGDITVTLGEDKKFTIKNMDIYERDKCLAAFDFEITNTKKFVEDLNLEWSNKELVFDGVSNPYDEFTKIYEEKLCQQKKNK